MPDSPADTAPASAAATPPDDRPERVAAIIRNGLSNGPIAWSQPTWDHLQTRLGEIARAIVKEL